MAEISGWILMLGLIEDFGIFMVAPPADLRLEMSPLARVLLPPPPLLPSSTNMTFIGLPSSRRL